MKFTKARQNQYLDGLRAGMRRGEAAAHAGLDRATVQAYIADNPGFRQLVADAEDEAVEQVEAVLFQRALSGNTEAAKTWLAHRRESVSDEADFNQAVQLSKE